MFFKPGVSGFTNIRDVGYVEDNKLENIRKFKQVCYNIVNTGLFKIKSFEFESIRTSFYTANIEDSSRNISILLNKCYPYLCFATSVDYFNVTYIDDCSLEKLFNEHYCVIKVSDLITPISQSEEDMLNKTEKAMLRYHDSQTIGDVIFNFWD